MEDLISRQAAIRWVKTECNPYGKPTLDFESGKKVIEHLEQMPSADRPRGEWVEDTYGWVYCSHCKKYLDDYQMVFFLKPFDYCPNCGARMKGADGKE